MGIIYRSHDLVLFREVAIKVLRDDRQGADQTRRFVEEAQVASQLQHPSIPPIHALGTLADGRPFFTMKIVEGRTFATLLAGRSSPGDSLSQMLGIFEQICQAMAYAHTRGVIHRDLKPSNVMVGAYGEVQVMDWGLAKVLPAGSDARLDSPAEASAARRVATARETLQETGTQAGTILGTFAYMPPEQARGEIDCLDPRSDVFGLGAILCEILTGRPPYTGTPEQVQSLAVQGDVQPALERLAEAAAEELHPLVRAALSPRPHDRPADASTVARAMKTYQDGVVERLRAAELAQAAARVRDEEARARGQVERRGRRIAFGLMGAVAVVSLIGGVASTLFYHRARAEAERASDNATAARANALRAAERAYVSEMRLAQATWEFGDLLKLQSILAATRPDHTEGTDFRGFEWHFWNRLAVNPSLASYAGHSSLVMRVRFSPDGQNVATGGLDGTVKIRDHASGREVLSFQGHEKGVADLHFSPDGRCLAVGGSRHWTVHLRDAHTGKHLRTLDAPGLYMVYTACFSPTGSHLAAACSYFDHDTIRFAGGIVRVWDSQTGKVVHTLKGPNSGVYGACYSPDGKQLAGAGGDGNVHVWDAATGQPIRVLPVFPRSVTSVCFSPTGKKLVAAAQNGTVKVWEAATGRELLAFQGHTVGVNEVCFSPDERYLATASHDRTVRVWDAVTGQRVATHRGHMERILTVAFSPDGTRILSGGYDRVVRTWHATSSPEAMTIRVPGTTIQDLVYHPDGKRLAGAGTDRVIRLWDVGTGQVMRTFAGHNGLVMGLDFSPDGQRLASASFDGTVRVWEIATGDVVVTFRGDGNSLDCVRYSPDGTRLATAGRGAGAVKVWDAATGEFLRGFESEGHPAGIRVAFSRDGKRLASSGGLAAQVWDVESGGLLLECPKQATPVAEVCFSPTGDRLIGAIHGGTLCAWDSHTGDVITRFRGHLDGVTRVRSSPDGKRIASAGRDQTVKVWDASSGQELLTLQDHKELVLGLDFSPDGSQIATSSLDGTVKVWQAPPEQAP